MCQAIDISPSQPMAMLYRPRAAHRSRPHNRRVNQGARARRRGGAPPVGGAGRARLTRPPPRPPAAGKRTRSRTHARQSRSTPRGAADAQLHELQEEPLEILEPALEPVTDEVELADAGDLAEPPGPSSTSVPSIASILSLPGEPREYEPSAIHEAEAAAPAPGAEGSWPSSGTSPSMVARAMGRAMEEGGSALRSIVARAASRSSKTR